MQKINDEIYKIDKLIKDKEKMKKMKLFNTSNNDIKENIKEKHTENNIKKIELQNNDNSSNSNDSEKLKKEKLLKIMKMKLKNKDMEIEIKPDFINTTINIYNDSYKEANEYTFDFGKNIKISKLSINSIELPKNTNNITDKNNQLKIFYKDKFIILSLEPDYYNRYDIVENLNDNFEANDILIKCILNKNDDIIFVSIDGDKFDMLDTNNSILNTLGFINGNYKNEDNYISTYPIGLSDNIYYLGFMNLYDEPLFKINMDNNEIILLMDIDFNNTIISELIVKFYFTPSCPILNQKYEHFYKKHSFNIII
jgi:hypothetical protein